MGDKEMKFDVAATWLKAPVVWGAFAILLPAAVAGTLFYAQMDAAIKQLQGSQAAIESSVGDIRDDLRKLVNENVAQRQFSAWAELFRALNKDLKVPELPR